MRLRVAQWTSVVVRVGTWQPHSNILQFCATELLILRLVVQSHRMLVGVGRRTQGALPDQPARVGHRQPRVLLPCTCREYVVVIQISGVDSSAARFSNQ